MRLDARPYFRLYLLGALLFGAASPVYAQDDVQVELKTVEDRVHATVTSPLQALDPAGREESAISRMEEETLKVAGQSSRLVGEGTDRAVTTVQKVSTPFFSRLLQALDFSARDGQTIERNLHGDQKEKSKEKDGTEISG